ncbi:MAG TPA: hypothetical protein VJP86_05405 [Vicinamibacterales bacterium]|nr:hypothetical protein [Vicinamibacterales bacterium]
MRQLTVTPPLIGFIAGTRAMLGFGLGLMMADRIPPSRRKRIALTLIGIGAATTIPAARKVFGHRSEPQ